MRPAPGPTGADDPLPDLLRSLAGALAAESIDSLWVFPTRETGKTRSVVVVVSAFEKQSDRRRILTAQRIVRPDEKGRPTTADQVTEHGSAPADRIDRLVEGVLRRLSDDLSTAPRRVEIAGEPERWDALLEDVSA